MAPEQTFSTQDLRSAAVDYNRDHESKHKWAHGQAWGPGRRAEDGHARPARPNTREVEGIRRDGTPVATHKHRARAGRKRDATEHQTQFASGESSNEDDLDIEEPSAAPEPDAEVAYSFDAARGPGHGSQVLGLALDKAIERYEVRATDKLIKDEYEVLGLDGEPVPKGKGKKSRVDDEDDFELV